MSSWPRCWSRRSIWLVMASPSLAGRRGTVTKTDRRSNSYRPTVGLSIEFGGAGRRMNKNVERGLATRARVVEVATRLFAEHGYDGTSIEAVQAGSGGSRGSLYHHFPGKEALFWAVLEEVRARLRPPGVDPAPGAPDPRAVLRVGAL